jgi:hypothetical protein
MGVANLSEETMKIVRTAVIVILESHQPHRNVRRVTAESTGTGLRRVTVLADFDEPDEVSRVDNVFEIDAASRRSA